MTVRTQQKDDNFESYILANCFNGTVRLSVSDCYYFNSKMKWTYKAGASFLFLAIFRWPFFSMKNGTFSLYSPPDWATSNLSDSSSFWKYATLGINHVILLPKLNHVIDLGSYQNTRCLLHLFCVLTGPITSMPNIIFAI